MHITGTGLHILGLAPNKPLVPTRNGAAPLLAAQRRRYTGWQGHAHRS
jgi:hypothetical protein